MKKFVLLVAIAIATLGAKAQVTSEYAAPLEFQLSQFSLDNLRAENEDINQLQIEVKYVQEALKKDADNIKQAQAQLKDERALLKSVGESLKDAKKHIESSDKLIRNQQKELDNVMKMLDKQLSNVHKSVRVRKDVRNSMENRLDNDKMVVKSAQDEASERLRRMTDLRKNWDVMNDRLTQYGIDLNTKEATINEMVQTNKVQQEAVKAELKRIATVIKESKKK